MGRCYERTRDQGIIGSVTARRHSRTPGGLKVSYVPGSDPGDHVASIPVDRSTRL
jgi:hypothetical protein